MIPLRNLFYADGIEFPTKLAKGIRLPHRKRCFNANPFLVQRANPALLAEDFLYFAKEALMLLMFLV